jgi:hypothetical protein
VRGGFANYSWNALSERRCGWFVDGGWIGFWGVSDIFLVDLPRHA